jgi:hypothetical protein
LKGFRAPIIGIAWWIVLSVGIIPQHITPMDSESMEIEDRRRGRAAFERHVDDGHDGEYWT